MPRRKPKMEDPIAEPILSLPPVRPVHPHKHEHQYNPYETPIGVVPGKMTTTTVEPAKETPENLAKRDEARAEIRAAGARWNKYLDVLGEMGGNQIQALAEVYQIPIEEVYERLDELSMDVRRGIGSTEVGRILERNDLDLAARMRILRNHTYSANAAASIAAIKILSDASDEMDTTGQFEFFLRAAKQSK